MHSNRVLQDAYIVWYSGIFLKQNFFMDKNLFMYMLFLHALADIWGYKINKISKYSNFYQWNLCLKCILLIDDDKIPSNYVFVHVLF